MEYALTTSGQLTIDFSATGDQEILQNVANIISCVVYSCPMHRDFALDASVLDKPMNIAQTLLRARIFAAVKEFESRATVTQITFDGSGSDGVLRPTVKVRIVDDG